MKSVCLICGKEYFEKEPVENPSVTHGLCGFCLKTCLIPIYRRRQLSEGNFDCFGKATHYCDQLTCSYRTMCLGRA